MKLILTGSSGFIGTNYIKKNKKHEIMKVKLSEKNLSEFNFKGFDAVIHLAALVHKFKGLTKDAYFKVNSDLTYETAFKSRREGIKHFVYLSTIKVFGENTTINNPYTENTSCTPHDYYAESKYDSEERILKLSTSEFKVSIIRPALVYGPGVKANMYNLIKLIDKIKIVPFGKINNKRSFVYIDNLINLIDVILEKQIQGIFLASDPKSISTTELVKIISKYLDKNIILVPLPYMLKKIINGLFPLQFSRIWNSLEINPIAGWKKIDYFPLTSTEKGIYETVQWYLKQKNKN